MLQAPSNLQLRYEYFGRYIPSIFLYFSLIFRVFTNFNKTFNLIICILDHLVNMLCLTLI